MSEESRADVLAVGAHPDDVELRAGGTLHKLAEKGYRVVICDLTRGEAATRGTPEQRLEEASKAAAVLGASERINLGLPDGRLTDLLEYRDRIIEVIRRFRPTLVLCSYPEDLHPDHAAAGRLLKACLYPAGIGKYPVEGVPWRPRALLFYMAHSFFRPDFIVDTTGHFEAKRRAVECYRSQLYNPPSPGPLTWVSKPDLFEELKGRDRYFGSLIGRRYGEPFAVMGFVPFDDPVAHFSGFGIP